MTREADDLLDGLDRAAVDTIVQGRHGDPFSVLGMHGGDGTPLTVRAFLPQADSVEVIDSDTGEQVGALRRLHPEGFFAGELPRREQRFSYRLRITSGEHTEVAEDPYRFGVVLGELDVHLLGEGMHRHLYRRLGAHPTSMGGVSGTAFAVWAPNASRASVVGDFNAWDGRRHPMRKRRDIGVFEIFIPGLGPGALYKYELLDSHGRVLTLKADPIGTCHEAPPATSSIVHGLPERDWQDRQWMEERAHRQALSAPISIYEVHLGSWRRGENDSFLSYGAVAEQLIDYVTEMGFTHVEFLPVSEHPFTGSWGYQPIGLYAPTRRFGQPDDFARLVERFHQAGIGVIMDWVPAHFPSDPHGLTRFDGTALYEHEDPRQGVHKDWNTLIYNYGRREVSNFLLSNATYWLDQFHIDALRVDAVASMLYLDYSRQPGEWVPNIYGGNENLEAIAFLHELNTRVFGDYPGATTIAEESTAFPGVSQPVYTGGLGFGYKWNMGWMHDTLDYMSQDPIHRRYHHHKIDFGLHYAFSENFILPLSHDEVVHGKGSLIGKMPGDRWRKFANLRAYYGFMWTHPGKKLLFMGGEFAQEREWNHDRSLDWHLLDDPMHAGMSRLVRDLNRLYRSTPALHQCDCESAGFEWIDGGNVEQSVFSYIRRGKNGAPPVVVVCNMTPVVRHGFSLGVPEGGAWDEILNTDAELYGGSNVGNGGRADATAPGAHGRPFALTLTLPPLATLVLTPHR